MQTKEVPISRLNDMLFGAVTKKGTQINEVRACSNPFCLGGSCTLRVKRREAIENSL